MKNLSTSEIIIISVVAAALVILFYSIGMSLLFFIFLLFLYFIPSFVAFNRKHQSKLAILALNIFLGWTFIGWVISLVWSLSGTTGNTDSIKHNTNNIALEIEQLAALKEKGIITESEFQKKKKDILTR